MEVPLNALSLEDTDEKHTLITKQKQEAMQHISSNDVKQKLREHKKRLRTRQQKQKQNNLDELINKIPIDIESIPGLYMPLPRLNDVIGKSSYEYERMGINSTCPTQEITKCDTFWREVPDNCAPHTTRLTSLVGGDEIIKRERKRQEKYAKKLRKKLEDRDITPEEMNKLFDKHGRPEDVSSRDSFSLMSSDRGMRKCWQVENIASLLELFYVQKKKKLDCVIDFGSGSGNLCLALASYYKTVKFIFVDQKQESLNILKDRASSCGLDNIEVQQYKFTYDNLAALSLPEFDLGIGLHCCGSFTDMVMEICRINHSDCIVCPCCNGKMGNDVKITGNVSESACREGKLENSTENDCSDNVIKENPSFFSYPRSKWLTSCLSEYEYLMYVSRAADDQNNYLAKCLIEYDRSQWAMDQSFTAVHLFKMNPMLASPKHHILYLQY